MRVENESGRRPAVSSVPRQITSILQPYALAYVCIRFAFKSALRRFVSRVAAFRQLVFPFTLLETKSTGIGNMMVEFFSADI